MTKKSKLNIKPVPESEVKTSPELPPKEEERPSDDTKTKAKAISKAKTKQDKINALLIREEGATLKELMEVTEWKSHSVRGHLSNMRRKRQINIEAFTRNSGERCYHIAQSEESPNLSEATSA